MDYMESNLSNNLSVAYFVQDSREDYNFDSVSTNQFTNMNKFKEVSTEISSEKARLDDENDEQKDNVSTQVSTSQRLEQDRSEEMANYDFTMTSQQNDLSENISTNDVNVANNKLLLSAEIADVAFAIENGFTGLSNNISTEHSTHDLQVDTLNSDVSTQLSTDKQRYSDVRYSHDSTSTEESELMTNVSNEVENKITQANDNEFDLSELNSTNALVNKTYDLTLLKTIPNDTDTHAHQDMVVTNQHFVSLGPYWRIKATDNELQFQFNQNPTDPDSSPGWRDIPFAKIVIFLLHKVMLYLPVILY